MRYLIYIPQVNPIPVLFQYNKGAMNLISKYSKKVGPEFKYFSKD